MMHMNILKLSPGKPFVKLSKKEDSDMQDCSVLKKMSSCDISDHTTSTNITGLEGISGDGSASRAAEVP